MLYYALTISCLSFVSLVIQLAQASDLAKRIGLIGALGINLPIYIWLWTLL